MVRSRLRGKYVPDRNGKLRPVLNLTGIRMRVPEPHSYKPSPLLRPAWPERLLAWLVSTARKIRLIIGSLKKCFK